MEILLLTLTDDPFDPPGHGRFGGSHAFFFDLARQLVRLGHDVTIATRLNSKKKEIYRELGPACRLNRIPVGPEEEIDHHSFGELITEISQHIKNLYQGKHFDIMQTSNWLSGAVASICMPDCAQKHVHHILSLGRSRLELGEEESGNDKMRDKWEHKIFNLSDALICVSEEEKSAVTRLYPDAQPREIAIIPYGIDQEIYYKRPSSADDYVCRASVRF